MTNDVGPASSKSKPTHCRNQQCLPEEEAQVYALLPCARAHPLHWQHLLPLLDHSNNKMITFLWCFFAGLFRFPISYLCLPFMIQFQILKAGYMLSNFHEFFRIQLCPMIMH